MTLEEACRVTDAVQIDVGGDQDWSHATNLIVYDKLDEGGVYQLHISRPDGSDARCLSCSPPEGAPESDVHKFHPSWHPSGEYFVVQVEKEDHPARIVHTEELMSELLLNGLWNDLYLVSADGSAWYRLTDTATDKTDGVLAPVFSPDGNRLMWSRLIEEASDEHPWGVWRLMLADVVFEGGVPHLANVRDITPESAEFIESHAFSPDGETVVVTSDMESQGQWDQDIWAIDLGTTELRNLTPGGFWDEHAIYTPDGEKVVYMSGSLYPLTFLKTDLMLKDLTSEVELQLTHFNVEGYPEYTPEQSMTLRPRWNADGTRISVTQQMADAYPARRLWVLTFTGPCGGGA